MSDEVTPRRWAGVADWQWTAPALLGCMALLGFFGRVGSDWDWVVALGDHVRSTGTLPDAVPFAAAPSDGWHNVPVLGEVVASLVGQAGPAPTVLAHLVLVVVSLLVLVVGARRGGGTDALIAVGLVLVVVGALPALGLVRLQSYSLPLFAALIVLVVSQAVRPDRWIWAAPPLVAVWGNLHGGVLLGVCVLGAYLLLGRLRSRPAETVLVGVTSLTALLVTPQGPRTVDYYLSVFDNAAADRGEGLWARPDVGQPFDVLLMLAVAVLAVLFLRRRRQLWEYAAVLGLAAATASAARHGVWLLFLLLVLATRTTRPGDDTELEGVVQAPARTGPMVTVLGVLAIAMAAPGVLLHGDDVAASDPVLVEAVNRQAGDQVVLAPAPLVESLAQAGVRIWAGNPLDAFELPDQVAYLDFLRGEGTMMRAVEGSSVVVTEDGSAADQRMRDVDGFEPIDCTSGWTCHVRE